MLIQGSLEADTPREYYGLFAPRLQHVPPRKLDDEEKALFEKTIEQRRKEAVEIDPVV